MKRMLLLAVLAAIGWAALADTADALWRRRSRNASNNCNCAPAGQPYQANYAPDMPMQQPGIAPSAPVQPGQPTFQTQSAIPGQAPAPAPANLQGGANLQGNPAGANVQGGANLQANPAGANVQGNTGVKLPGTP